VVYGIFADYHTHHPAILPRPAFEDPVIEQGGHGAGTVFRIATHAMGQTTHFRMTVSEPEPGRVLVEEDAEAGVVTTFTVEPEAGGTRSRVTITTELRRKPGLAGWIEGLLSPRYLRRLYEKELEQVAAYAQGMKPPSTDEHR
jgi:phage FluMu protein gp41